VKAKAGFGQTLSVYCGERKREKREFGCGEMIQVGGASSSSSSSPSPHALLLGLL